MGGKKTRKLNRVGTYELKRICLYLEEKSYKSKARMKGR
jgi:hypothetical protein